MYQAVLRPTGRAEPNAAQHYVAAAELLLTWPEWDRANGALLAAARAGDLGDDDSRLRNAAFVQANAEALRLLAQARTLDFHGFNVPLRFRYIPTPTCQLPLLLGAAALERIQQGDGDDSPALIADLLATLREDDADSRVTPYRQSVLDQAAVLVSLTVRHAPPSEAPCGGWWWRSRRGRLTITWRPTS